MPRHLPGVWPDGWQVTARTPPGWPGGQVVATRGARGRAGRGGAERGSEAGQSWAAVTGRGRREVAREKGGDGEIPDKALDYRGMAKPH